MTYADTLTAAGFGLAFAGFITGAAALVLALVVMRQNGTTTSTARKTSHALRDLTEAVDELADWARDADAALHSNPPQRRPGQPEQPPGPLIPPTAAIPTVNRPRPEPRP